MTGTISFKGRITAKALLEVVAKLPEAQKMYILGYAEGMADQAEAERKEREQNGRED